MRGCCVPVTVGVTTGRCLVDPSLEEERQQDGALTCVWDSSSDELLFVSQVRTLEPVLLLGIQYSKVCHDMILPAMLDVRGVPAGSGLAIPVQVEGS